MTPETQHQMPATVARVSDEFQPRFVDEIYDTPADDLGDWWLDLGGVDVPRIEPCKPFTRQLSA